jgi:hypothetical protein
MAASGKASSIEAFGLGRRFLGVSVIVDPAPVADPAFVAVVRPI